MLLDRHFISRKAARDWVSLAQKGGENLRLGLSENASVLYTLPLQDLQQEGELWLHDIVWLNDTQNLPQAEDDPVRWLRSISARATELPKKEMAIPVRLPTIGEKEKQVMKYPVTSTVVVSVEHWVHLLWLNQIAFGIRWMDLLRKRPLWGIFRALSALSFNRHRLLSRMVKKGRHCDIHPTAKLSGTILGDNVRIGSNVHLQNCIVGDNAVIEDHAVLSNSVVGENALILQNTYVVSCLIYPEATVGNMKLQVSLVGRGSYINSWVSFIDARFSGFIKVAHNGELKSTERAFLGSCVGHRATLAAKVLIQPGREIPNDAVVLMRPDEVISTVPEDLPQGVPLVRDRGTLVPLGQES